MDFRVAHSRSADAAQSATRNRPGLRAVRDEAKLPKHQESVPIPAKVLDLPIPCDADERRGNAHSLVGRRYRLGSVEGTGMRPCVDHLEDECGVLGENPLLRPLRVGEPGEVCGRPGPPATTTHPEVRAVRPNSQEPVRCQRLDAVEIVGVERVEQSLGDLSAGLTVHEAYRLPWPSRRDQRKRLVRSSVQTQGRSCVGGFIIECGAYSRIGAKDWVDTHRKSSRTGGAELGSCRWDIASSRGVMGRSIWLK